MKFRVATLNFCLVSHVYKGIPITCLDIRDEWNARLWELRS